MNRHIYELMDRLRNPERKDLIDLADVPQVGADLAMEHIALMRENGEVVSLSLLALEALLKKGGRR